MTTPLPTQSYSVPRLSPFRDARSIQFMSELLQFSKRCRSVWVIAAKRVTLLGLIVAGWPVDAKTANASARCIIDAFFRRCPKLIDRNFVFHMQLPAVSSFQCIINNAHQIVFLKSCFHERPVSWSSLTHETRVHPFRIEHSLICQNG